MKDSGRTQPLRGEERRWLLFIHRLPPKPDYLRVKVRRRLRRLGAVPVKQTVYVLPRTDEAVEDFHWLRVEIEAEGGSAVIVEAAFIEGLSDEELEAMIEATNDDVPDSAPSRTGRADRVEPGTTWVTRQGVQVDRIASGWLIQRFIDPKARFKFVAARGYQPTPGELRFDMFDAEYTHVGDACTFQTLVRRFVIEDAAVRAIAEIVHDIDCKDEQFGRPETAGIASLVRGIVAAHVEDETRLERGGAILDDFYASFRKGTRTALHR
jgi:hypothetical protein